MGGARVREFSQCETLRTALRAQARKIVGIARKPGNKKVEARSRARRNVLLNLLASVQTRIVVVSGGSHISTEVGNPVVMEGKNRHRGEL